MLAQTHTSRDVLQYVLWGIILLGVALMVALWVASPHFAASAPEYAPVQDPLGFISSLVPVR
jgi:hypothetical protein